MKRKFNIAGICVPKMLPATIDGKVTFLFNQIENLFNLFTNIYHVVHLWHTYSCYIKLSFHRFYVFNKFVVIISF